MPLASKSFPAALRRCSLGLLLVAGALGCPAVTSRPCTRDDDCPGERCRRGACGPVCLADSECGTSQLCRDGACIARPECQKDDDCAADFACVRGACRCQGDSACAANQQCLEGACIPRKRCSSDTECASAGRRCELTQGICVPPCSLPTDCAPGMDPRLATALYTCVLGTCTRRCLDDAMCGSTDLVCKNGVCAVAECKTLADCPAGQYCTSATFGRCVEYQTCTSSATCPANFECRAFTPQTCPPGFECARRICQERPTCLTDGDCPVSATGPRFYCEDRHCQPTTRCSSPAGCPTGQTCVAGMCVPFACRGLTDCPSDEACVGGRCLRASAPGDVARLVVTPSIALLEVGETQTFRLVGFGLDGQSFPFAQANFQVLDAAGGPTSAATVNSSGTLTAVSPGKVLVRATLTGTAAIPAESTALIVAPVTTGRRVVTIDAATGTPLANVKVVGCDNPPAGPCPAPTEVVTDAWGTAAFPSFSGPSFGFSAVAPAQRSDGYPRYDRLSVTSTTATHVLVPLTENPVHGAAGFNATVSFSDVSSSGAYWVGLAVLSTHEVHELDLRTLLGDPFMVEIPLLSTEISVPGSVVLFTSPGFGIPQELKGRSLGLGHAGTRHAAAFAGRGDLTALQSTRSLNLLSYTQAMDYDVQAWLSIEHLSHVPDTTDLDNDKLCTQSSKCPLGSEDLPDYAHFRGISFRPARLQLRRTEVVLAPVASSLDSIVVSAIETSHEAGVLPLGFSSAVPKAPGTGGTRPVDPILLRSGAPYGGTEVSEPGIWAMAFTAQAGSQTATTATGRLSRFAVLPHRVMVPTFLPLPLGAAYQPGARTFFPGQPAWDSIRSLGGDLGRLTLTGPKGRHLVFFSMAQSGTIRVPDGPASDAATDPAAQAGTRFSISALDLAAGVSADQALDLPGPNLWRLSGSLDGYSRDGR